MRFYSTCFHLNCDTVLSTSPVILGILCTAVFSCTMASESNSLKVLTGNAQFAKSVYNVLSKEAGNVFFSPISAHTVLSLAYQGSKGATAEQFSKVLQIPEAKACADGYKTVMHDLNNVINVTLYLANKVFVKDGYKLKKSFRDIAVESFSSEVEEVNFSDNINAAKTINIWVENKTHEKIKDLISADQLKDLTRLVLVNAIYFKGNWANKFDPSLTKEEPFYISETEKINVQMMHLTKKFYYTQNEELDAQVLELPYENQNLSLVIILPNERNGIKKLESKLQLVDLTTITNDLFETEVELSLPKFKIESKIDFKKVLKEMGLDIIFDANKANFSDLLENPDSLYVSDVVQKAFIEVNEEGAEAAAATGVLLRKRRALLQQKVFKVEHTFLIYIMMKESAKDMSVLFCGRIIKPNVSDGIYENHDEL